MPSRAVTDDNWHRLADKVIERRTQLDMTQQDVQAAGGPATATLRNIEGAHQTSYRRAILARLERALGWAPGSVNSILAGGDPTPATSDNPAQREDTPSPDRGRPVHKTLADVLLERGLRSPDQIVPSDHVVDPLVDELLARPSFTDDFKNSWLDSYSVMRRQIREATEAEAKKKPRDQ